jgi:hypothetical protein
MMMMIMIMIMMMMMMMMAMMMIIIMIMIIIIIIIMSGYIHWTIYKHMGLHITDKYQEQIAYLGQKYHNSKCVIFRERLLKVLKVL